MKKLLLTASTALLLTGCSHGIFGNASWDVGETMEKLSATGPAVSSWQDALNLEIDSKRYSDWLQKDYKALAMFENDAMYDYEAAKHFAKKSMKAAKGADVMPDMIDSREISIKYKEEAASAYNSVIHAYEQNKDIYFPKEMARLQVAYDCWLEQIEEDHQENHILKCKDLFYKALGNMQGIKSSVIVYFEHDSFKLIPDEAQKLSAVVKNYNVRRSDIVIEGHTDAVGGDEYNQSLSLKRAKSVKKNIKSIDRHIEDIEVKALGESSLAINTDDGVSEPRNRRAIIHFK